MEYDYRKDLHGWFGLSYAAFVVMPRVAMMQMPKEWQEKMAELLHEYDETINTGAFGVHSCFVTVKDKNNKLRNKFYFNQKFEITIFSKLII